MKVTTKRYIRVLFASAGHSERVGSLTNDGFQRMEEFHHFLNESERQLDLHP